jgi:hypothetical protein
MLFFFHLIILLIFYKSVIKTQNDCLLECVTDCDANTCCGQSSNQPNSIKLCNKSPKNSFNEGSPKIENSPFESV